MRDLYPGQETAVNEYTIALYNMFLCIGSVLGMTYGSFVSEAIGARACCTSVSVIILVFALLYFCFADGLGAIRSSRWRHYEKEELDAEIK